MLLKADYLIKINNTIIIVGGNLTIIDCNNIYAIIVTNHRRNRF